LEPKHCKYPSLVKCFLFLVWYSIDRGIQDYESIFFVQKTNCWLDWNYKEWYKTKPKKNKPKTRQNVNCILIFFMYLTCQTGHTIADFLFWKNQNKWWRNCYKKIEVNWFLLILFELSLCPSNICLKNIFQLNCNRWLKSCINQDKSWLFYISYY
jgi:hypothetical protein